SHAHGSRRQDHAKDDRIEGSEAQIAEPTQRFAYAEVPAGGSHFPQRHDSEHSCKTEQSNCCFSSAFHAVRVPNKRWHEARRVDAGSLSGLGTGATPWDASALPKGPHPAYGKLKTRAATTQPTRVPGAPRNGAS